MNGTNPVISPQMRFGLKLAVIADLPQFFRNLGYKHDHAVCDRKRRRVVSHAGHLVFCTLIIPHLADFINDLLTIFAFAWLDK